LTCLSQTFEVSENLKGLAMSQHRSSSVGLDHIISDIRLNRHDFL